MNKEKKLYFLGHHKEWGMIITDVIARPLALLFSRYTSITANQISIISFFFVIVGCYFFLLSGYKNILIGSIFAFAYNVFDMMDGMVAREKNQSSLLGQWLDGIIGFITFQALIISLAIGLQNYLALILGMFAAISYPTQYCLLYYYRAEVMPYQDEIKVSSKISWMKNIYGLSFFYIFLLFAGIFNKPIWVLIFWATFGNIYWVVILILQYLEVRKHKSNKGKPKYRKIEEKGVTSE